MRMLQLIPHFSQGATRDPDATRIVEAELHAGTYEYLRADAFVSGGNDRIFPES